MALSCVASSCEPAVAQSASSTSLVPVAAAPVSAVPIPPPEGLLVMIRSHVLAAGQAVATNSFDVLRAIASEEFRAKNTADDLRTAFAELHNRKFDLAPVVVLTPVLTDPPGATADGHLRLVGVFPSRPVEIPFGLLFVAEGGVWKLSGLSLGARTAAAEVAATLPLAPTAAVDKAAALKAKPAPKKDASK